MRFKVGDKVRVREDLQEDTKCVVDEMLYFKGLEGVVTATPHLMGQDWYKLSADENFWCWTDEMLEPIPDDAPASAVEQPDVRFPAFQEQPDNVNHPQHYKHGEIETLDIIRMSLTPEEFQGFLKGNVLKYQLRAPFKHETPDEDYKKAKYYYDEYREVEDNV